MTLLILVSKCIYVSLVMDLIRYFWQMMELSVKRLFDTVESIHDEMYYLRDR